MFARFAPVGDPVGFEKLDGNLLYSGRTASRKETIAFKGWFIPNPRALTGDNAMSERLNKSTRIYGFSPNCYSL